MGSLSLNRIDHLLWLGRYLERSFTTQRFILSTYDRVADRALDDLVGDWRGQLADLGFRCETETPLEFFQRCLFNRDNPSSVACSMDAAYDNALACRDALGTESLGYIQMAVNALEAAGTSASPLLDLQQVQDNIMAFKGCIDDFVTDDAARCLVKCGMTVERVDLCARLRYRLADIPHEVDRLASRLDRTGAAYSRPAFKELASIASSPSFPDDADDALLSRAIACANGIFS